MLTDAIARLTERIKNNHIQKSSGASVDSPDLQNLASKVTTLLDQGAVKPESENVKDWAMAQGVGEEDAKTFANDVIDAYFEDTSNTDVSKSEFGSAENEEEKEEEEKKKKEKAKKEEEKEIEKSKTISEIQSTLEILKAGQETLAAAIEHLLDRAEDTAKIKKDFQTLKSELGQLALKPGTEKTPVTTQVQKSNPVQSGTSQVAPQDRDKVGDLIIKGMEQGKCQLEDMAYFQSTYSLSERASKFVNEQREVLK
ncbi:hypothetical protein [Leptospira sanjuanensis]|uniref:hypothetical protein n=1 Tax=Leptospira sanjuanensis TaxID=2879643 RepID=UPI001EE7FFC7|nr:hypothetical protein [Leptospira sanjuanensis]MCG6170234.1 hypothetical protein [Leptospira sanjuanensis]